MPNPHAKIYATATRKLHENIGHGIIALVRALPTDVRYQDEIDLGKQIDALIKAGVKAGIEGRQTTAQVSAKQQSARQAFARALARKVAKLG